MDLSKLAVTLSLVAGMGVAHGAAVTITFNQPIFAPLPGDDYDSVSIHYPSSGATGSLSANVNAGRFVGQASNLVDVGPEIFVDGIDNVYMYCYDIYQPIGGGNVVVYNIDFAGATDRTLQFLQAVNTVMNGANAGGEWDPYAWVRPLTGLQGAAIQLGIWESLYDNTDHWALNDGLFRSNGLKAETLHWVDTFFDAIDPLARLDQRFTMVLRNDGKQDMLTADPPGEVPEPGALALLGTALAALVFIRRRRG